MKCIVDGMAVEYEERGSGPVILMLHGWGNTLHTFDQISRILPGRILRVDLPGFGESEIPKVSWTLNDYVNFVKAFIEKLCIAPEILVGHSLGGRIVIKGLSTGVLSARKAVLIASAGVAERNTPRNFLFGLVAKIGRSVTSIPPLSIFKDGLRRYLYKTIGSDYFNAGALRETFLNIIKDDLNSAAKTITVPTLILWGEDDDTTPLADGKRLHTLIRTSTLRTIPHTGHFVHQETPSEVSAIIREFIQ